MPRSPGLLPGIALLFGASLLLAACSPAGGPTVAVRASMAPTSAPTALPTTSAGSGNAPWTLNLDFSGDLTGHVTRTAAPDDVIHDECTGADSSRLGQWASTMALTLGGQRYSLVVLVPNYRGAGAFTGGVSVELSSEDHSRVWQNEATDQASFTVGADEMSGLLTAVLSNAAATSQKVNISGHWSCQP